MHALDRRRGRSCCHRRRPGWPCDRLFPPPPGTALRDPRERRRDRFCLARALGVADAVHAAPLQRAAGAAVSRRSGGYPGRDEVIAYLERHAGTFHLPIELNSEVKRLELGDTGASASSSPSERSPPTRWWSRPVRSSRPTFRRSRTGSLRTCSRRTPPATANQTRCRKEPCLWSGVGRQLRIRS